MNTSVDPQAVKAASEAEVLRLGGKVCDWLPTVEIETLRSVSEVADRTLAMHGMVQLAFDAPKELIRTWLSQNALHSALSSRERNILASDADLGEQERTDLYWYIEALWALAWVGSLVSDLRPTEPVGSNLAALLPDIRVNEGGTRRVSGILCARHIMTKRSMYAKQDEDAERGDCREQCGTAEAAPGAA